MVEMKLAPAYPHWQGSCFRLQLPARRSRPTDAGIKSPGGHDTSADPRARRPIAIDLASRDALMDAPGHPSQAIAKAGERLVVGDPSAVAKQSQASPASAKAPLTSACVGWWRPSRQQRDLRGTRPPRSPNA